MIVGTQSSRLVRIAGVKAAPSITPITADMGGRTTVGAAIGARRIAAIVQKVIGPSIQGSGNVSALKIAPPMKPRIRAAANLA